MWVIVGLGNPGEQYKRTRHNIGFMVIDRLAQDSDIMVDRMVCQAVVGRGFLDTGELLLAKPQTYMNRSGLTVACLARTFTVPLDRILVIVDDLALPLGRLRLRRGGGDGGHNGLKSIINHLDSDQFPRLRLGIGVKDGLKDKDLGDTTDFVLSAFDDGERPSVTSMVDAAPEIVRSIVKEGIDKAMMRWN